MVVVSWPLSVDSPDWPCCCILEGCSICSQHWRPSLYVHTALDCLLTAPMFDTVHPSSSCCAASAELACHVRHSCCRGLDSIFGCIHRWGDSTAPDLYYNYKPPSFWLLSFLNRIVKVAVSQLHCWLFGLGSGTFILPVHHLSGLLFYLPSEQRIQKLHL